MSGVCQVCVIHCEFNFQLQISDADETKHHLPSYDMYQALGNTLLNLLVAAAENCEFMIHTLSGTTSISGSVQYPLRMNLILSNFELSNWIG